MSEAAGYKAYADLYRGGAMQQTFMDVSVVLSAAEFASLSWGNMFSGTTVLYQTYRDLCVLPGGSFNPSIIGTRGLTDMAWELAGSAETSVARQKQAYVRIRQNLRAVMREDEIKTLGWPKASRPKWLH